MKTKFWTKSLVISVMMGVIVAFAIAPIRAEVPAIPEDPFAKALAMGNAAEISAMIAKDPNLVNQKVVVKWPDGPTTESPVSVVILCCKKPREKWLACLNILLAHGADPNQSYEVDPDQIHGAGGSPPLYSAMSLQDGRFVNALVGKGARLDIKDVVGGWATPLHFAANGDAPSVKLFLSHGAKVDALDDLGRTPLLVAVDHGGGIEVVRLLLAAGADPNVKDKDGKSALDYLNKYQSLDKTQTEIKKLLLSAPVHRVTPHNLVHMPIRQGEILLSGAVVSADATTKKLVLKATTFTLPSGKSATIAQPKDKTVSIDEATAIHASGKTDKLTLGDLKTGDAITVIGPDAGSGNEMAAREIIVGAK